MTKRAKIAMNLKGVDSEVYADLVNKGEGNTYDVSISTGRPRPSIRRSILNLARLGLIHTPKRDEENGTNVWAVKG